MSIHPTSMDTTDTPFVGPVARLRISWPVPTAAQADRRDMTRDMDQWKSWIYDVLLEPAV
jgi:hypothetical protein